MAVLTRFSKKLLRPAWKWIPSYTHGRSFDVTSSQPYLRIALLKFGKKSATDRPMESRAHDKNAEKKYAYLRSVHGPVWVFHAFFRWEAFPSYFQRRGRIWISELRQGLSRRRRGLSQICTSKIEPTIYVEGWVEQFSTCQEEKELNFQKKIGRFCSIWPNIKLYQ